MAERRVSVRLAAVGGDRLKADLAAIGREGKAALAAIAGGSGPASHGLAATSAAARTLVTRLEAVSARAGAAAATMRGLEAAGGVVARIDRTTGVTGGLRRDAADIEAYGRALDDTRAKYNPMFAAVRSYRAELAAIRAAHCHRRDLGRRDERGDRPDEGRFACLDRGDQGPHDGDRADGLGLAARGDAEPDAALPAQRHRRVARRRHEPVDGAGAAGQPDHPDVRRPGRGQRSTSPDRGPREGRGRRGRQRGPRRPRARPGASGADRGRRGRRRRARRAAPRDQRDRRDPGLLRRRDAGGLAVHPRRRGLPW